MTRPRSQIAPHRALGAFHCARRCARRAFLCGVDRYSGQSFEHRRSWIEQPIRLIGECFAVAVDAHALMSNHLHLVLRIDPGETLRERLATIDRDGTRWTSRVAAFGSGWHRAAGSAQDLSPSPGGWDSSGWQACDWR